MTNPTNQSKGLSSQPTCSATIAQYSLRKGSGKIRSAHLDNESDKNAFRRLALPTSFGLSRVFLTLRCSAQGASDATAFGDGIDAIYFR